MFTDATSVVRVCRYFKSHTERDSVTGLPVTYQVALDWGIGRVDRDGLYIYGSPYQLFSNGDNGIYGDAIADSRVLAKPEIMTLSGVTGDPRDMDTSTLHFKYPNI